MSHVFHFLDDVATADLAFDAFGDSLQELFQGATCAVIGALADPTTVGSTWLQTIERTDENPAELLFDGLSALVYWKDAAGVVFSRSELTLTRQDHSGWKLTALLYGEPIDASSRYFATI
jgi:SHS2 domain-containing protein